MAGGGTAGGGTAGGGTAGGTNVSVFATLNNTRFVGIAQVDISASGLAPIVATLAEPLDGGTSLLHGWANPLGGMASQTRSLPWSSAMQVHAIASNAAGTTVIAGRNGTSMSFEVVAPGTNFATTGAGVFESNMGPATSRVSRLTVVNTSVAPIFAFIEGGTIQSTARLYRVASGTNSMLSVTTMTSGGLAYGDDVINSPLPPIVFDTRMLMVARCSESCTFTGMSSADIGLAARFGWFTIEPLGMTAGTPLNLTVLTSAASSTPVFNGNARTRVASDGNQALYFAGQGLSNELVIERRSANPQTGGREAFFTSVGAVRLVDLKRSPSGQGVLVLAVYSQSGASFEGSSLPFTTGVGGNVVLLRLEAGLAPFVLPFDRPGDQQPVGFATAGSDLVIAVNEGPNAVLWKLPTP